MLKQPKPISFLPVGSFACFGTNPYGEPLYRVAWSESRQYLVGGNHVHRDGRAASDKDFVRRGFHDPSVVREEQTYDWLPLYPGVKKWILERWLDPLRFAGPRSRWEIDNVDIKTGLQTLGPYPDRGEYQECFQFPGIPGWIIVADVINSIEYGRKFSHAERRQAYAEEENRQRKLAVNRAHDIWTDAQGAFDNRPSNVNPAKKTADDINFQYGLEDLPRLPKPRTPQETGFKFAQVFDPERTA